MKFSLVYRDPYIGFSIELGSIIKHHAMFTPLSETHRLTSFCRLAPRSWHQGFSSTNGGWDFSCLKTLKKNEHFEQPKMEVWFNLVIFMFPCVNFQGCNHLDRCKTANITSSFPLIQRTLQQISHRNGDIFLFHSNMAEGRVSAFGQFEGENSKHKNYACHLLTYHPLYRIQQEYPPENHHISHPSRHFRVDDFPAFQLQGRCIRPLERSSSQT